MATSQADASQDARTILEGQIRECYGRVVYSHKTHEKCADILLDRLATIKLWQIILSALTTGTLISVLFGTGKASTALGVVISTALLVLNAYTKNYDLGELAQKHRHAAAEIWLIREQYLALLTDLAMNQATVESIQIRRDKLLDALHSVYLGSPSTSYSAYKKAQQALKRNEDMTFSNEEIDMFLPEQLRRSAPKPSK